MRGREGGREGGGMEGEGRRGREGGGGKEGREGGGKEGLFLSAMLFNPRHY